MRAESRRGVPFSSCLIDADFFSPPPACSKKFLLAPTDPPARFVFSGGSCCRVGSGRGRSACAVAAGAGGLG